MKHALGTLIGCGLAFLVVFLLPFFGVNGNAALVIFFVLMIGCHLFMGACGGHGKENHEQHGKNT